MALYMALIWEDQAGWQAGGEAAAAGHAAHGQFGTKYADVLRGGQALQPTSTATTIRHEDGDGGVTVTDGPWAETKEALGGFYLFEAPDLDAALAIAKDVPAPFGGVELRPVMEVSFD